MTPFSMIQYLLSVGFLLYTIIAGNFMYGQNSVFQEFVTSASLKYAGVGIKVVEIETGKTVYSHNENLALCPASSLKVLTTASALEILGKDYLYHTKLYTDGSTIENGVLNGTLYIQGNGDPTLGSTYLFEDQELFLWEWLEAIKKAGITHIKKGIRIADEPACFESLSSKWIMEDVGNYFAAEIYPINVFDNSYKLLFKSGKAGTIPEILRTEPEVDLIFENFLKAATGTMDSAYIRGMPFSYERHLYGTIPANRNEFSIKGAIPRPPLFLGNYFKKYLEENGIKVDGEVNTVTNSPESNYKLLYSTPSASLAEIIKVTNFRSNNMYAEALLFTIGKEKGRKADCAYLPAESADYIKKFWKSKGIDTNGIFQYDGSGLAPSNAISAGVLTDILLYMNKKSRYADIFFSSLPEAGKEGTVRNFLKANNKEIYARIKSGSISNVQSYAGYIEKNGKKYTFTVIVNNFTGKRNDLRMQIQKLLLNF